MRRTERTIGIVVLDHHILFREGLLRILKDMPEAEIAGVAEDERQIMELLQKSQVDIILLNYEMLVSNGLQIVHSLKRESPETKILILGNNVDEDFLISALEAGIRGFLPKKSDIPIFFKAIRAVYHGDLWVKRGLLVKYFRLVHDNNNPMRQTALLSSIDVLSAREKEVLSHLAGGHTNKEIASRLFISEKTVKNHLRNIFKKLSVNNRLQASLYSIPPATK